MTGWLDCVLEVFTTIDLVERVSHFRVGLEWTNNVYRVTNFGPVQKGGPRGNDCGTTRPRLGQFDRMFVHRGLSGAEDSRVTRKILRMAEVHIY